MDIIIEKEGKIVYMVTDKTANFKYIVKKGSDRSIDEEYKAYLLLFSLESDILNNCLPTIYNYTININGDDEDDEYILVEEYVEGYTVNQLRDVKDEDFWICLLRQLSYFIYTLEENMIQHNDLHLGNIIIRKDSTDRQCQLKILDLETVTDYRDRKVYSSMIEFSDNGEKFRMGWSNEFHPGSDLNQIIGEILDNYPSSIPQYLYDILKPRIIKYDKEYPYAITESNNLTTGASIINLLENM